MAAEKAVEKKVGHLANGGVASDKTKKIADLIAKKNEALKSED